jgi:hypothetical protein
LEPIRAPESELKRPSFFPDTQTAASAGTKQTVFHPESMGLSMPKPHRFVTEKKQDQPGSQNVSPADYPANHPQLRVTPL